MEDAAGIEDKLSNALAVLINQLIHVLKFYEKKDKFGFSRYKY